jgi:hypothetical protein
MYTSKTKSDLGESDFTEKTRKQHLPDPVCCLISVDCLIENAFNTLACLR